jgi:hypothetical protein
MSTNSEAPQTNKETGPKIPQTPAEAVSQHLPAINAIGGIPLSKTGARFAALEKNIATRRDGGEIETDPLSKTGARVKKMIQNITKRRGE